jgi:hypothetical protein
MITVYCEFGYRVAIFSPSNLLRSSGRPVKSQDISLHAAPVLAASPKAHYGAHARPCEVAEGNCLHHPVGIMREYNNSIADAVADLGRPEEIGTVFAEFQKYLYRAVA